MNSENSIKICSSQEFSPGPSTPNNKKVVQLKSETKIKENKIARDKRRLEHHKRMQSTLFRAYIQNLLRTDQAQMDFRTEFEKEKVYNKKHNLKMWLR